jgi:threonine aldolase
MTHARGFASDNSSGVHPDILQAIVNANTGHALAYGDDHYTAAAVEAFRAHLGPDVAVYFVFGGTGANVAGLSAVTRPHQAVLCSEHSHIHVDECGAPERFGGFKLLPLPAPDGKLALDLLARLLDGYAWGDAHRSQPRVLSFAEATEYGTVYTPAEIAALAALAHRHDLLVHVDGARIANAAAGLNVPLRALTTDAGVDLLSFGGTKNGMLYGEAVVFFDAALAPEMPFVRKQATQLPSKMRFVAAQFSALLAGDLWRRNAAHANAMARRLAAALDGAPGVRITQPVEANAVFAALAREHIAALQRTFDFYVWDETLDEVRWMTSFDTTPEDVDACAALIREVTT